MFMIAQPQPGGAIIDTFTGSGALSSHVPDAPPVPAETWLAHAAYTSLNITSNRAEGNGGSDSAMLETYESDYWIECDARYQSSSGLYLMFRSTNTTHDNDWTWRWAEGAAINKLYSYVAGTPTLRDSNSPGNSSKVIVYKLTIRVEGSSTRCWIDGAYELASTYSYLTENTLISLLSTGAGGAYFDNLEIYPLDAYSPSWYTG